MITKRNRLIGIFQFHKGTIKTDSSYSYQYYSANFNSIKVRLKQKMPLCFRRMYQHFNSIKVRLKRYLEYKTGFDRVQFQFHKGTIKTTHLLLHIIYHINFNSIKVRLKLLLLPCFRQTLLFQFHKGTIKTYASPLRWLSTYISIP